MLDAHALDQLEPAGADSASLVRDIIDDLVDAAGRVAALRGAVGAGDVECVRREAHALKGTSATIGAMRLAELCGELERRGREGAVDGATALSDRLEGALDAARDELSGVVRVLRRRRHTHVRRSRVKRVGPGRRDRAHESLARLVRRSPRR